MERGRRTRNEADSHRYEIRVQGHLDDRWEAAFEGLTLTREPGGTTVLAADVEDQAALHGILRRIRDLGMPLVSVARVAVEPGSPSEVPPKEEE